MIIPKKAIKDVIGYPTPLYPENYVLKLDLNENILGPSPRVLEALRTITEEDIKFYPAYGELIDKIAEFNSVLPDMILPTCGADEAINYIFDTFTEYGDCVLTVEPSFAMPKIYAKGVGCNYKEIKYTDKWNFPVDEFLKNIDESLKLIIITTPNSPTGESILRGDLIRIIEAAPNIPVLVDETYSSYAKEKFTDLAEKYSNVIIVRSMSKDFALAGLRIGYIISQSQNIEYIRRIISPFSVNTMAVKAGIAALTDKAYFENVKNQIFEAKKLLIEGLKPFAEKIYESDTNFLLMDFGNKAEFVYKKLLRAGIKVKWFNDGSEISSCFRIAVPAPEQAKLILDALKSRELIVFDIDGVIIDTRNSYRMAIKSTYEHFAAKEITFEDIQEAKNLGGLNNDWDLTEFLLKQSGLNIAKQEIIDKFQELYWGNNGDGFILNEEILIKPETFKKLSKKYDLAIFTGRPKIEAEFVLKRWGLDNLFAPVITMDDLPEDCQKPHPMGLNNIISVINPLDTYYLGDTPDDMIAAKGAGVKGIGVLPPQDKTQNLKDKLVAEGAFQVINNTEDIVKVCML